MKSRRTRVSDLAEVATCQRRVYLRAKLGERQTNEQAVAKARGEEVHQRMYLQKRADDRSQDRRCFIATAVYGGDAPQTAALRRFRDRRLTTTAAGMATVDLYYRVSPAIARWIDGSPRRRAMARRILNVAVRIVG